MIEETVYIVALRPHRSGEIPTAIDAMERRFFFVLESAKTYANAMNQQPAQRTVAVYRTRRAVGEPVGGRATG